MRIGRRIGYALLAGVVLLIGAFAVYEPLKPARVVAPQMFGLTCPVEGICVEDPTRLEEATLLRDAALQFVTANIGPLQEALRVLFCSTTACFARFGPPVVAAVHVGGLDTIILNETGWQEHIVRHELIHQWQVERFGVIAARQLPRWYIEGMAYALSEDPRDPLPRADIQTWRSDFQAWVAEGNDWREGPTP